MTEVHLLDKLLSPQTQEVKIDLKEYSPKTQQNQLIKMQNG